MSSIHNMQTKYHEQTYPTYKNVKYGQGTVYSSGCGPASLCNCLDMLGIASVTVKAMCAYSESIGARVPGGTDEQRLLKYASQKYGFKYKTTSKNSDLLSHLRAGGVAILHGGSNYKLFSNGGHFVAAIGVYGNDITVMDSYWYDGKYTSTALRKKNVKVLARGIIRTSIDQIGKATADRSPSYYLISKINEHKENDDMTYYKTIANIPSYYKESIQKLIDKDALKGTGNGELNISEDFCKIMTVLNRLGILDK